MGVKWSVRTQESEQCQSLNMSAQFIEKTVEHKSFYVASYNLQLATTHELENDFFCKFNSHWLDIISRLWQCKIWTPDGSDRKLKEVQINDCHHISSSCRIIMENNLSLVRTEAFIYCENKALKLWVTISQYCHLSV